MHSNSVGRCQNRQQKLSSYRGAGTEQRDQRAGGGAASGEHERRAAERVGELHRRAAGHQSVNALRAVRRRCQHERLQGWS